MREKILKIFKNRNDFISGEQLSQEFGVSRAAIWKHVNQLRKNGYEIISKPSLGYKLVEGHEQINKEELNIIVHKLDGFFKHVEYFKEIDSTNQYAKKIAERENILIIAESQSEGKGRLGRSWESKSNQGIYMTLKLHPELMPSEAINITQIMALAVIRAMKNIYDINFEIKWPNDIVYKGKKVAGILTEMITEIDRIELLVIGMGINVFQESFDGELEEKALSLVQILKNKDISRLQIIEQILKEFIKLYPEFLEYRNLSFVKEEINLVSSIIGKDIMTVEKGRKFYYKAIIIDDEGQLIVEDSNGERKKILYGEVSIRGTKSYGE